MPFEPSAELAVLRVRSRLLQVLRTFFLDSGYWEVETPVLSRDVTVDAHLEPFCCEFREHPMHSPERVFLQTSPEFAMKRLLAAGADAIFQIGPVMRNEECGRLHNPEFTMVEWYRRGDSHLEQMDLTERLVKHLWAAYPAALEQRDMVSTAGESESAIPNAQQAALGSSPFRRLTYDEAFERAVGQPVLSATPAELVTLAERCGVSIPEGVSHAERDALLNLLLAVCVEPTLGQDAPEFLYEYPASQAALARTRSGPPAVAERFELYLDGVELCNGYHELTDAEELRRRCLEQNRLRRQDGRNELPVESRLLDAMDHGLPPCAGVALGWDRLIMKLMGYNSLSQVMAFPWDRT